MPDARACVRAPATAADYANMIRAAIRLHAATGERPYLEQALSWSATLDRHYWHQGAGGYCISADDTPDVIARLHTAATTPRQMPNAIQISNLVHLSLLTGDASHLERASRIPEAFAAGLQRNLVSHTGLLSAAFDLIAPQQIVVVGHRENDSFTAMTRALRSRSMPGALEQIVIGQDRLDAAAQGLAGKTPIEGKPTAYLCSGPQCSAPITDPQQFAMQLDSLRLSQKTASSG